MPHPLIEIERVGDDSFLAPTERRGYDRLYGGQVAAQSLRAACVTVGDARLPHSLHSYFILAGRAGEPVELSVQRTRDGRSFSTRHVTASQGGKAIFELIASFHVAEAGDDWQLPPPPDLELPPPSPPEESPGGWTGMTRFFEIRPEPTLAADDPFALHPCWLRARDPVGDDAVEHICLLAFLSDLGVLGATRAPVGRTSYQAAASLDHSVWFHRPARVDDWMRFSAEPITNFGARGLARGAFHARDGALVASVAQESLLRPAPA
jgi:acyl-CoA thioesterase II